jgi:hypothetical protein
MKLAYLALPAMAVVIILAAAPPQRRGAQLPASKIHRQPKHHGPVAVPAGLPSCYQRADASGASHHGHESLPLRSPQCSTCSAPAAV